jgi:hypothetical protein
MDLLKSFFAVQPTSPTPSPVPPPEPLVSIDKAQVLSILQESVDEVYLTEDPGGLVAGELRQVTTVEQINERLRVLAKCLQAVNHGLYLDVIAHYDKFVNGMENIHLIEHHLRDSKELARRGRQRLLDLKAVFLGRALKIVETQRRRQKLEALWNELQVFGEVCLQTSLKITQAIEEGELYRALTLCSQATAKLESVNVREFQVYQQILSDLLQKQQTIRGKMLGSISQLCGEFEGRVYENLLLATSYLDSFETVKSALLKEFAICVRRCLSESVGKFTVLNEHSTSLTALVRQIPTDCFVVCFRRVARKLSRVLYNHHLFSQWHDEHDRLVAQRAVFDRGTSPASALSGLPRSDVCQSLGDFSPKFQVGLQALYGQIKTELITSRKHIWADVQENIAGLFNYGDQLDILPSEDICKVLRWTDTLVQIGEDFSGSNSPALKEAVETRCRRWFKSFHSTSWNNLA